MREAICHLQMRIVTKHETNSNRDVEVVVSKDQIDTFNKDGVILIKKALNSKTLVLMQNFLVRKIQRPHHKI